MNLVTSRAQILTLPDEPAIAEHFADPTSCAGQILEQLEEFPYGFIKGENLIGFDLGANIGLFALHIQDRCRQLVCVEPTPSHFSILTRMTSAYPNITNCQIAVADYNGEIDLSLMPQNTTMNCTIGVAEAFPDRQTVRVTCRTLAALIMRDFNLSHVDFVKMDIEGAEESVMTPQQIEPLKDIVKGFYVECHQVRPNPVQEGRDLMAGIAAQRHDLRMKIKHMLSQLGYKAELIRHDAVWASK